jgi:dTDP-4-dehydrorhamnose reductase
MNASGPVLLLGARGMLGRAWTARLERDGREHRGLDLPELDVTVPGAVAGAFPEGCRLVVNCSGYTDVDGAERHPEAAEAVNAAAVGLIAAACRERGALLVHYSTDYVFGGTARRPYAPDAPTGPLNVYGRSKLRGEELLRASGGEHLLVRTSWLYAPWGKNFVRTIAALARRGAPLRVVDDQTGRPTSAEGLAAGTLGLLHAGARGTFHLTDGGQCTWFDFAVRVAAGVNPACRVERCSTAEFPRPARRPAWSVLDTSAAEAIIGPLTPWEENLAAVLERLE